MSIRKSLVDEINTLVAISTAAFNTDVLVGGDENEGPPGYDSTKWHKQMLQEGHLYTYLSDNGQILGGAILFEGNNMPTGAAEKTFDDYMKKWSIAKGYSEKIVLIDILLHAFHLSLVSGATHRPVAMNFMDGTREQIESVISNLAKE